MDSSSKAGPRGAAADAPVPPPGWNRGWRAFHRQHLFDYNPSATRFWLVLALLGLSAVGCSLAMLSQLGWPELLQIVAWTTIVGIAAGFPIEIPRTRHSIAVGDVLIFLLLALHGPAAAVCAAALEGYVAACRGSVRVSSRIGTLAAGAVGMALAGGAFAVVLPLLAESGLGAGPAELGSLVIAALVYFPAQTIPQMQVFCLKRGETLAWREWFEQGSWVGTLYLFSALIAGLLALNARLFGRSVIAVSIGAIGIALAMVRTHFRQQALEHEAQEARVAAAELEAQQNQQRFHAAFSHAAIGMTIVSHNGSILQANLAICSLLGYGERELLQMHIGDLLHPSDAALLERRTSALLERRDEGFSIELRCMSQDRREIWVSLHCALFDERAAPGAAAGLILQLHDITSRRRAEGELQHIAYHDSLTDLANRNCFQERLRVAVERHRTGGRNGFAVMYLDLDRFKVVNDSLGHSAGDELLKIVGRRLKAHTRPRDLVARLGGDEFAILLEERRDTSDMILLGERLVAALEEPVRIGGTDVRPQASIGLTFSHTGDRAPEDILRDADLAMYQAKNSGKGRLTLFDPRLHDQIGHGLQLEADLRRAIREGTLSLAYQPLYQLEPYRLTGFEALARWVHPTRGPISPAVFIQLAEESGCIGALTAWAIDEASRQLAEWRSLLPQCRELVINVNVSGKDLSRPLFVEFVRDTVQRHALPPQRLTLEITESTLMEHREVALQALAELRELGVRLGIDDFGTGYSSLAYLSTLPFDCLKIDRSFVMGIEKSPQNLEIVRTVVSLGLSLNKHVVAEGIETAAQLAVLKELGATIGQGYLLGRPLAPSQVLQLLEPAVVVEAEALAA